MSFAAALADPMRPPPSGLEPAHRFAVYRNNMAAALTTALAVRYPATRRLVGEAFFAALARAYAGAHLPASPVLIHYGAEFPDFIAGFEPAASVPYLADVARLESAWWRAYHAADVAALEPASFAAVPPARLGDVRFSFHPGMSLLASAFPADAIWNSQRGDGDLSGIDLAAAGHVLVARSGAGVAVTAIDADYAGFLARLQAGATLLEAGADVAELTDALTRLIASRIVTDLSC